MCCPNTSNALKSSRVNRPSGVTLSAQGRCRQRANCTDQEIGIALAVNFFARDLCSCAKFFHQVRQTIRLAHERKVGEIAMLGLQGWKRIA
jgi:hypothetical protein